MDVGGRFSSSGLVLGLGLMLRLSWVQGFEAACIGDCQRGERQVGKKILSSLHLFCKQSSHHTSAET